MQQKLWRCHDEIPTAVSGTLVNGTVPTFRRNVLTFSFTPQKEAWSSYETKLQRTTASQKIIHTEYAGSRFLLQTFVYMYVNDVHARGSLFIAITRKAEGNIR